jgi:HSP20 family protein
MMNTNNNETFDKQAVKAGKWIVPYADIFSSEDGYHINLDMPGVPKEKFSLKVSSEELLVKGETERSDFKADEYYYNELDYAGYERTFILPNEIDPDKISAVYENGVLMLTLNKRSEFKPKLIEIK